MMLRCLLLLILISPSFLYSQYRKDVRNFAECYENSFIGHPGDYELQFTGRYGIETDFNAYSSLSELELNNTFWYSFVAPHEGLFLFSGIAEESSMMDILIFSKEQGFDKHDEIKNTSICDDINRGTAVIERIMKVNTADTFGLNKAPNEQFMYGLRLSEGQEIYLMFNSSQSIRFKAFLNVKFEVNFSAVNVAELKKSIDVRKNKKYASLRVHLRDKSTGLPIKGKMIVRNSKKLNGLYNGSEFIFSIRNRESLSLSIDAEGYFFIDKHLFLEEDKDHELTLWLEPAELGRRIELDGIQFEVGSSEFIKGAEYKLARLKDFLLLNSSIHIEIRGHVHEYGESTFAGKRMSSSRAKAVMKYLIDNGIERSRLSANGYGNEFMIYPEPKFDWQEQANRRVDIRIIKND
ncbi:hypothetical protein CW751_01215 [Brumimicrobium salinarum]|uniref:OmpA-like domain-containing protein n=1 Tax=Brumimicrobium salinarum TaxID=2058658 RepID=A0A2I0R5Y1_9FLAO|nr:OmpA family protein [Brumimicrobium salinarum]PKR81986.1 hypothetical protein CW751_01215 [Brumimicrobium salinarum]